MEDPENNHPVIYQCNGANCRKKKGKRLDFYMKKYNLKNKVDVETIGCNNKCEQAPVLHLDPANIWFYEKDLSTVIKRHILNNK